MTLENNVKASFRDAKIDILSIKDQLLKLAEETRELKHLILNMQKKSSGKKKVVRK